MENIQLVPHASINKEQWDTCIHSSFNQLIYGSSVYLDAMSPQWDALILGNYEAVMPITWRSKMAIRYVCQPAFTQQLGLFCTHPSQLELLPRFLEKLALQFRLVEIMLNHENRLKATTLHHNFILPIHQSYKEISKNFTSDFLKNLKRSQKFNLQYLATDEVRLAMEIFKDLYASRLGARPEDYLHFTRLVQVLLAQQKAFVRKVLSSTGELLAIGIFLIEGNRIYNMASSTLPNGRMMEANHFLFDQLIQEFCQQDLLLDFEGSDMPGIARFYQKFGAVDAPYGQWKLNRLPAILRWWKR